MGDIFHKPISLSNDLIDEAFVFIKDSLHELEVDMYAISGNHDLSRSNFVHKKPSPSYIRTLSKLVDEVNCWDLKSGYVQWGDVDIYLHGVPYLTHNKGFVEYIENIATSISCKNILMIHRDLPGAVNPMGYAINETSDLPKRFKKLFKKFDLVLCGHIHKPQKLGKNIYMIGSPKHQNRGDSGCEMGYWELHDDMSMHFKPLNYPQFKYYKEGDKIDTHDYWIEVKEEKIVNEKKIKIINVNNRKRLARKYLRYQGIKDKHKLDLLTNILNDAEV